MISFITFSAITASRASNSYPASAARAPATESAVTSQIERPFTRTAWARGLRRRPPQAGQGRSLSRMASPSAVSSSSSRSCSACDQPHPRRRTAPAAAAP